MHGREIKDTIDILNTIPISKRPAFHCDNLKGFLVA